MNSVKYKKENSMKKLMIGSTLSVLLASTLLASTAQDAEIVQLRKDVEALKIRDQEMKQSFEGNSKS
jgi:hypothetical protein